MSYIVAETNGYLGQYTGRVCGHKHRTPQAASACMARLRAVSALFYHAIILRDGTPGCRHCGEWTCRNNACLYPEARP